MRALRAARPKGEKAQLVEFIEKFRVKRIDFFSEMGYNNIAVFVKAQETMLLWLSR